MVLPRDHSVAAARYGREYGNLVVVADRFRACRGVPVEPDGAEGDDRPETLSVALDRRVEHLPDRGAADGCLIRAGAFTGLGEQQKPRQALKPQPARPAAPAGRARRSDA